MRLLGLALLHSAASADGFHRRLPGVYCQTCCVSFTIRGNLFVPMFLLGIPCLVESLFDVSSMPLFLMGVCLCLLVSILRILHALG